MVVFTRSLKGFAMEPDEALTARGGIRSCPCALLGFILKYISNVKNRFHNMMVSQLQSKSVRRSLTRHGNSVYMCLASESSALVDNQIFCNICKILVKSFRYLARVVARRASTVYRYLISFFVVFFSRCMTNLPIDFFT